MFQGPHLWGTISRTYIDRSEYQRRGRLLRLTLLWFLVGPVMIGMGFLVEGRTGRRDLVLLFFLLAALWAYHHVVKQHWGFLSLYRAKAGKTRRWDALGLKYYLVVSLWLPAVIVLTNSPSWLNGMPFVGWIADRGSATALLSFGWFTRTTGPYVFYALQGAYVGRLLLRVRGGNRVNLPEVLLVATSVSLHWVAVRAVLDPRLAAVDPLAFYAFVPIVTIFHDVQYQALVWHYNKCKYHVAGAERRYGWAARLNRNLLVYGLCGATYAAATIGVETYGLPGLGGQDAVGRMLAGAIGGYSFIHYYLDSKIWHLRENEDLRRALGFPLVRRPHLQPA